MVNKRKLVAVLTVAAVLSVAWWLGLLPLPL